MFFLRNFCSLIFLLSASVCAFSQPPASSVEESQDVLIYNRILGKVGSRTISVLDVVKKMDVFLNTHYPEVFNSNINRFQFYTSNWKDVLEQMVDSELILADAGEKDYKISDGDVREALLERFGPNVMASLDKCGLSYEEARKMVREDLTVQRVTWFKVQAKALQEVGPKDIKNAYVEYLNEHPSEQQWTYQVLSIRVSQAALSEMLGKDVAALLHEAKTDFTALCQRLEEKKQTDESLTFQVSDEITATERTISKAHREGLSDLKEGEYSHPITQISRNDGTPIQRIFFLKNHTTKTAPAFQDLKDKLRGQKIETAIQREDKTYKLRLRQRFNHLLALEELPPNFEPFSIDMKRS